MKKHIISVLVQNQPGVLAHIAGMFAARGFNIDSLVVGRTEDPEFSRMVIVSTGDDLTLEQMREFYDAVIFSTGAIKDAQLPIDGIDLEGSYGAADFVSWYDAHPEARRVNADFDALLDRIIADKEEK